LDLIWLNHLQVIALRRDKNADIMSHQISKFKLPYSNDQLYNKSSSIPPAHPLRKMMGIIAPAWPTNIRQFRYQAQRIITTNILVDGVGANILGG